MRMIAGLLLAAGLQLGAVAPALAGGCPPDTSATLRLVLNLPAYRLDAYEAGRVVRRYRVAIGARRYPTPLGQFAIARLELNPWWVPPDSPWAKGLVPVPPGPRNPTGRAKLLLQPLYYVHGTPDSGSVGHPASHGCVRMKNSDVLDLAARALEAGRPEMPLSERLRLLQDTVTTHRLTLADAILIDVRYDLLEVVGDSVHAYPDVYGLRTPVTDAAAQRLLERAAGYRRVRYGAVGALLDAAGRSAVAVALDSVLVP